MCQRWSSSSCRTCPFGCIAAWYRTAWTGHQTTGVPKRETRKNNTTTQQHNNTTTTEKTSVRNNDEKTLANTEKTLATPHRHHNIATRRHTLPTYHSRGHQTHTSQEQTKHAFPFDVARHATGHTAGGQGVGTVVLFAQSIGVFFFFVVVVGVALVGVRQPGVAQQFLERQQQVVQGVGGRQCHFQAMQQVLDDGAVLGVVWGLGGGSGGGAARTTGVGVGVGDVARAGVACPGARRETGGGRGCGGFVGGVEGMYELRQRGFVVQRRGQQTFSGGAPRVVGGGLGEGGGFFSFQRGNFIQQKKQ